MRNREKDSPKEKIIILNSCSPSRSIEKKHSASYTSILDARRQKKQQDMINNLSLRGKLYLQGRKRFCSLRNMVNWEENKDKKGVDINPLLPFWQKHHQFARIDTEDLNSTYKFIGDLFKEEEAERLKWITNNQNEWNTIQHIPFAIKPQFISKELFIGLYTVAATNKRQKVMKLLRERWSKLFGGEREKPWSWKEYVDIWKEELQKPIPGIPTSQAAGGKKRKTRRKRHKNRKKKKTRRTKRRRKKKKRKKKTRRKTKKKK